MKQKFAQMLNYLPSQRPIHCLLSAPTHAHCGQKSLPHIYTFKWERISKWRNSDIWSVNDHAHSPGTSFLPFVWWDIDAICKAVSLRDHFYFLWTVVDNISPRLSQKRLQTLNDYMGKVVIIGCIEGVHSQCNNIVYTGKINQNWKFTFIIYNNYIINLNMPTF